MAPSKKNSNVCLYVWPTEKAWEMLEDYFVLNQRLVSFTENFRHVRVLVEIQQE
jgi:hypothetical protein